MITPVFEVRQDEDFVFVEMRVPHMKVSSFDFYVEEDLFKFYAKPYFLKLVFPGRLVEDGREQASYDLSAGLLSVRLPKETKGMHFADLDLVTLLQAKSKAKASAPSVAPVVEMMEDICMEEGPSSSGAAGEQERAPEGITYHPLAGTTAEEWDWDWVSPSTAPTAVDGATSALMKKYCLGFAGNFTAEYFNGLEEELTEILDHPKPGLLSREEVRAAREEEETEDFCVDHYLCDLMQSEDHIECLLRVPCYALSLEGATAALQYPAVLQGTPAEALQLPSSLQVLNTSPAVTNSESQALDSSKGAEKASVFTDQEKEQLRQLQFRDFLLSKEQEREALLSLVDIVYAYLFDIRVMQGEHSVESAWAVCKLSSTLSWLERYESLDQVVKSCMRRSLTYPMCRHWSLAVAVLEDTQAVFAAGKRTILKCLLAVRKLFAANEFKRHLNTLYLNDYCVWIQRASPKSLSSLGLALKDLRVTKKDIGWSLEQLEAEARSFCEEYPLDFEDPQRDIRPTADPSLADEPTGEEMDVDNGNGTERGSERSQTVIVDSPSPLIQVVSETDV